MRKIKISGSVTIEATLSLSVFLFGYLAVLSLVFAVRTECAVQCALDQTAAEISQYCYAAEKLSLSEYIGQAGVTVGETIENIAGFSDLSCRTERETEDSGRFLYDLTNAFSDGSSVSGIVGEPVYRAVFSKCLAGNREKADRYLYDLAGITADDIDLHYSDVLRDGKTIEMVAVYKVNLKTFGLFGSRGISLKMKNTAVTSAWTSEYGKKTENIRTKWQLSSFERGKAWVAEIKSEHSMDAVKGGKGIDLYRLGKYTMINSLNVFASTYSECKSASGGVPEDYCLKETAVFKVLKGYSEKLIECIDKNASSLQFENGIHVPSADPLKKAELIIVVPQEAGESAKIKNSLEDIAEFIWEENGTEVIYEYREKALK